MNSCGDQREIFHLGRQPRGREEELDWRNISGGFSVCLFVSSFGDFMMGIRREVSRMNPGFLVCGTR